MGFQSKLQLFHGLLQNQSLAELKKQVGDQGIEVIQRIADACERQDSRALLQYLDKYLWLASVAPKAIEVSHAEVPTEAFNDIRDWIAPVLEEIKRANTSQEREEGERRKQKKQRRRFRLPWRRERAE
jgi:hypothetical protein